VDNVNAEGESADAGVAEGTLSVLMLGDVVGQGGLDALERILPVLIRRYDAAFVVANGENAADGYGMTESDAKRMLAAGVDVITGGNHIWEKRPFWRYMDAEERVLRPANYPEPAAGRGYLLVEKGGFQFLIINLQGRDYMTPIDCPFRAFDRITGGGSPDGRPRFTLVDFHAEATREKEALGFYADGRASVFAGTHTHIQTADAKILPKGTAYITDIGMTGPRDGIIGMETGPCVDRALKQFSTPLRCATGAASVQGVHVRLPKSGGAALSIEGFTADGTSG
jgi:metallophosphoesterase (TIGR00282 family)